LAVELWQSLRERTRQAWHPRWRPVIPALLFSVIAFRALAGFNPGNVNAEAGPLFTPSDTAPGFVYGLVLFILYMRHRRIARAVRTGDPSPWGLLLALPALPLFLWASHTGALDLELVSLVLWLLGAALLSGGRQLLVLLALPVLLLLFAYPMPPVIANHVVWAFQRGTAATATFVLNALGVFAVNEGDVIYARGRIFEVIETCSGLRITETLLLSAFAYGQILCAQRRHIVALVLFAPFLGFALNAVRVLLIVAVPDSGAASDHTIQGLFVIVVGVFALAGVDSLLHRFRWGMTANTEAEKPAAATATPHRNAPNWAWTATALGALLLVISLATPVWTWTRGRPPWSYQIPMSFDGWTGSNIKSDKNFFGSIGAAHVLHRRYERRDESVEIFVGMDDRLKRDGHLLSPKHAFPGPGWEPVETRIRALPYAPDTSEVLVTSAGHDALLWRWYEGDHDLGRETLRQVFAIDNSTLRRGDDLYVFRVSTAVETNGRAAAEQRLAEWAQRLHDVRAKAEAEAAQPPG
jgi:exosortase